MIDDPGLDLADVQAHDAASDQSMVKPLPRSPRAFAARLFQETADDVFGDPGHMLIHREAADPGDGADRKDAAPAGSLEIHNVGPSIVRIQPPSEESGTGGGTRRELVRLVA
jgi:hypothetical protein